ncbi:hypothetical protein NP233_g2445 [Leucocoprinus birnbaumii]|uniref:Uncharacterized protein n=1 Tax=Leucocoprinus birnbaumii TaxID=56174 RepID=A0AAD5W0A0_9AGAR|nr:hypothetical protein NP233_g2445 [Leucocoprinus birnbaumii]
MSFFRGLWDPVNNLLEYHPERIVIMVGSDVVRWATLGVRIDGEHQGDEEASRFDQLSHLLPPLRTAPGWDGDEKFTE